MSRFSPLIFLQPTVRRALLPHSIPLPFRPRRFSTFLPRFAERAGVDPKPSPSTGAQHVPPADIIAQAQPGVLPDYVPTPEVAAEVISGAPNALLHRQVRIYKPNKATNQSGKGKTNRWLIDWDTLQGAGRWENDLMGWASTADYMQGTVMAFRSKEDAIAFAEKQGWDYQVSVPKEPKIPPKNYASNYVHVPGKLRIHHTK